MLTGAEKETERYVKLDPSQPDSGKVIEKLLEQPVGQKKITSLSIYIGNETGGSISESIADVLLRVLPNLDISSITLQINSYHFPAYFSKIIPAFAKISCTTLSLDIPKLNPEQLKALFAAVRDNLNIKSFTIAKAELLEAFDPILVLLSGKKGLQHLGLRLAKLNTERAAAVINALGPRGLESLEFSRNETIKEGERFDLLCSALLEPKSNIKVLHLTVPFGGTPEKNQTQLVCDTLAKIDRNFDLVITFGAKLNFTSEDFKALKNALFLNPRLCIYFQGFATQLKPFQNEVDAIELLTADNSRIRNFTAGSGENVYLRRRYQVLESLDLLPLKKEVDKKLAIQKELGLIPSLQNLAARFIRNNLTMFSASLNKLAVTHLELLPPNSFLQYYNILTDFKKLSLESSKIEKEKWCASEKALKAAGIESKRGASILQHLQKTT